MKKFRKFDSFDLILIFCVLAIFSIGGLTFFRKSTPVNIVIRLDQEENRADRWSELISSRTWFAQTISPEMTEKDGLGKIRAKITSVFKYDLSPGKQAVFINAQIFSTYTKSTNTHTFKGKPVAVGEKIIINLEKVTLRGMIVEIENMESKKKPVELEVEARLIHNNPTYQNTSGVENFLAEAIKVGDTATDYNQKKLIEVLRVEKTPANTTTTTSTGQLLIQQNPLRKDVTYTLKVYGYELLGKYYYLDDFPISINEQLPLSFPTVSVLSTVTRINKIN